MQGVCCVGCLGARTYVCASVWVEELGRSAMRDLLRFACSACRTMCWQGSQLAPWSSLRACESWVDINSRAKGQGIWSV